MYVANISSGDCEQQSVTVLYTLLSLCLNCYCSVVILAWTWTPTAEPNVTDCHRFVAANLSKHKSNVKEP